MKQKLVYLVLVALVLSSCKKAEELRFDAEFSALNIWLGANLQKTDSVIYNYAYKSINETDTISFTVRLAGLPSSVDREFELKPIGGDTTRILKDVHYVLPKYVLKAGAYTGVYPLYIKKSTAFKANPGKIIFGLKENSSFKKGSVQLADLKVILMEDIVKPANWDADAFPYFRLSAFFGVYSYVKFQFITTAIGQPAIFRVRQNGTVVAPEVGYQQALYFKEKCKVALADYNAAHPGAPLVSELGETVIFP